MGRTKNAGAGRLNGLETGMILLISSPLPYPSTTAIRMRTLSLTICSFIYLGCCSLFVQHTAAQNSDSQDFKLQGEYVGTALGLQVVATGDGGFDMSLYAGGLPGAGWDRTPPLRAEGNDEAVEQLVESRKLKKIERRSPTLGAAAPPEAIVLFDGTDASLAKWQAGAKRTPDGLLIPGVTTKETFRDYSLHAEFQTPFMAGCKWSSPRQQRHLSSRPL